MYTPWLTRVLAYLIDNVVPGILVAIGYGVFFATGDTGQGVCYNDTSGNDLGQFCSGAVWQPSGLGYGVLTLAALAAFAFAVWNYGLKQGTTGSSIGKGIMKFKVVGEATGQPIGFGMSIVRQLAHAIDSFICGIGYLFPLWDPKRQTIADKLMKTVCLPL